MMSKKQNIFEYDVLRVIVTILVLISHCMYYRINTSYGGIDYSAFVYSKPIVFRLLEQIKEIIYCFHMPLFMALSGALFQFTMRKKQRLSNIIISKSKRLLLPFVIVTIFYDIPLKYLSGYWKLSKNMIRDAIYGQLLIQGNTYLWFLPTLFCIFIVVYLISKTKIMPIICVVIFTVLNILSYRIRILLIQNICIYLLWFYLGFLFEIKRLNFNKKITKVNTVVCCGIFIIVFYFAKKINSLLLVQSLIDILLTVIASISTYMVAFMISKTEIRKLRIFEIIKKHSFGLYLYSDPWNYIILLLMNMLLGNMIFNTNVGVGILFLSRFGITTLIALVVSKLFSMLNLKYFV